MEKIAEKIKSIQKQLVESWPFIENEVLEFLKDLSDRLRGIYQGEREANTSLKDVIH